MYEQLSTLDSLKITPPEGGLLNIVLALVMYGVAVGVVPSRFKHIFTKPKSILLGLFGQWVLLPALTYLLVICQRCHKVRNISSGARCYQNHTECNHWSYVSVQANN